MAGEWIKMRTRLKNHSIVRQMATCLMANEAFMQRFGMQGQDEIKNHVHTTYLLVGFLHDLWGDANDFGKVDGDDVVMDSTIPKSVDTIAPGLSVAMEQCGWIEFDHNAKTARFPKFCIHNVIDSERKGYDTNQSDEPKRASRSKELRAERNRRYRERKQAQSKSATQTTTQRPKPPTKVEYATAPDYAALETFLGRQTLKHEDAKIARFRSILDQNPVSVNDQPVDPSDFIAAAIKVMPIEMKTTGWNAYISRVIETCRVEHRMPQAMKGKNHDSKERQRTKQNEGRYTGDNLTLKPIKC